VRFIQCFYVNALSLETAKTIAIYINKETELTMSTHSANWTQKEDRIVKTFKFETFPAALAFMVEVGLFCEKTDHHPEWKNVYNKIYVELTTHDSGGVTPKDTALAEHMDKIYGDRFTIQKSSAA
jgi:4a-hydroxytetrahydrobiopterin dehydratase